jgi:hypothetical protein
MEIGARVWKFQGENQQMPTCGVELIAEIVARKLLK